MYYEIQKLKDNGDVIATVSLIEGEYACIVDIIRNHLNNTMIRSPRVENLLTLLKQIQE